MAKVVGPLHSIEARGAVGALVYNTWRGISTVRSRVTPLTENSTLQLDIRAKCKLCTISWQSLTNALRLQWRDYANNHTDIDWTGNPKRLLGYNWYVRINVRRLLLGLSISTSVPTNNLYMVLTHFYSSAYAGYIRLYWDNESPPDAANLYLEFYTSGPHSAARNPGIRDAKRLDAELYSALYYDFYPPAIGWYRIWYRPMHAQGTVTGWQYIDKQLTSM